MTIAPMHYSDAQGGCCRRLCKRMRHRMLHCSHTMQPSAAPFLHSEQNITPFKVSHSGVLQVAPPDTKSWPCEQRSLCTETY
jgi:hypothetical protein